jgi:excisionase family DNA binding protein
VRATERLALILHNGGHRAAALQNADRDRDTPVAVNEARQRSVAQISAVLLLRDAWHTAAMHREQKPENRVGMITAGDRECTGHSNRPDARALAFVKVAYSVGEACDLLSIGRSSLYAAVKCGELKPVKLGRRTLLLADDLAAFLRRLGAAR